MRPRTRRLKSLSVVIGGPSGQATGETPPSGDARGVPKARSRRIRECASLCLARAAAGAWPTRLGADQAPGLVCIIGPARARAFERVRGPLREGGVPRGAGPRSAAVED